MKSDNLQVVNVDLDSRSYDIVIGEGLLEKTIKYAKKHIQLKRAFIITDQNVANLHLDKVKASLESKGIEVIAIALEPGEQTKSFESLEYLINTIFLHKPERKDILIALGGGVIGDLCGFAASVILRGINFIQIPTTLLAQVDSSVGGKTAINIKYGKNLVGSFYQPKLVLADIDAIKTLPSRDFLAGYAEVVKYGLINDTEFFGWLDDNLDSVSNRETEALTYIIKKSCEAKAQIVSQDEKESGKRALLNLGHTFGHVLENKTGYSSQLLHGEAVAIGMVMAAAFSVHLGICDLQDRVKIEEHLKRAGLYTSPNDLQVNWDIDEMVDLMFQDKKVSNQKLVFILMNKIGESFVKKDVDAEDLKNFLNDFINK